MDRRPLGLLAALASVACTPKSSGPGLWRRACTHAQQFQAELDIEPCVTWYGRIPSAAADDLALCTLRLEGPDADGSRVRECVGPPTAAFLAKGERTRELVEAHATAVKTAYDQTGEYPPNLTSFDPPLTGVDAFGTFMMYSRTADGFQICSVGYDGTHQTEDDVCNAPTFIYFQF